MSNTDTTIFERDGDWIIAYCPEIPGANGQGRTQAEARDSLAAAITLILQDRREDALRGLPDSADERGTRGEQVKCILRTDRWPS
ncbi:MAG: type II toxin-antitoxin system HicB family antitoxin [Rhodospirillales bacterium]|nr:type II toxin-antitoxin system HicB family antitoxin [Rhodospirillales bacterium]